MSAHYLITKVIYWKLFKYCFQNKILQVIIIIIIFKQSASTPGMFINHLKAIKVYSPQIMSTIFQIQETIIFVPSPIFWKYNILIMFKTFNNTIITGEVFECVSKIVTFFSDCENEIFQTT